MLVGGTTFARHRVGYLLAAVGAFFAPAAAWYLAARVGWLPWPEGSTKLGLVLGILAALIIAFEMLLWPRKKLRGRRLGKTRTWMYWHVWLGLACLPLAVTHSGFQFGGTLTTAVMVLFLLVIGSGIWGLALQQILPQRLLDDFPLETITSQLPIIMAHEIRQAETMLEAETRSGDPLRDFFRDEVAPYLLEGDRSRSPLRSSARVATVFADRMTRQPGLDSVLSKLKAMCDRRRAYDRQARIHGWLHNWLCVHVPMSVALCVLLVAHIVTALKYW